MGVHRPETLYARTPVPRRPSSPPPPRELRRAAPLRRRPARPRRLRDRRRLRLGRPALRLFRGGARRLRAEILAQGVDLQDLGGGARDGQPAGRHAADLRLHGARPAGRRPCQPDDRAARRARLRAAQGGAERLLRRDRVLRQRGAQRRARRPAAGAAGYPPGDARAHAVPDAALSCSYWKYPLTSTIRSTCPPPVRKARAARVPAPSAESCSSALLARFTPARKLSVLVGGGVASPGNRVTLPAPVCTTVTLSETARAVAGMPQLPATGKTSPDPEVSGPAPSRESKTRHGGTV